MQANLNDMLVWAEKTAREAGEVIRDYFDMDDKQVEIKHDRSQVTIADKKINELLIDRVKEKYPDHGVLGEEESWHAERSELWVCDPIDGTKGFILGVPTAMFSLAYVADGQPLAAVMYEPMLDKMFTAVKNGGARLNSEPIKVSAKKTLNGAKLGFNSSLRQTLDRKGLYDSLFAAGALPQIIHGNVFKGALVAQGKLDGYVFPGRSAHDIAAEKLIVEEAGGKVTDVNGNEQRYDRKIRGAIISNGLIHAALSEQLQKFGTERYLGF